VVLHPQVPYKVAGCTLLAAACKAITINENDTIITKKDATIAEREATIKQLSTCLAELELQCAPLKKTLQEQDAALIHIKIENVELSSLLNEVEAELKAAKAAAKSLEQPAPLGGVRVMRPTTKRNHQAQYGISDTEKMSVGNTHIIVEQVNRQGKSEF
jgi:septal ring factor EnvC (AmiA/AmiB activator)